MMSLGAMYLRDGNGQGIYAHGHYHVTNMNLHKTAVKAFGSPTYQVLDHRRNGNTLHLKVVSEDVSSQLT